jgi:hypothetical protein
VSDAKNTNGDAKRKRGRPRVRTRDQEWFERKIAEHDRHAAYYQSIAEHGEPSSDADAARLTAEDARRKLEVERELAADLRARMPKKWRANRPSAVWTHYAVGAIHAGTYDPVETRHVAFLAALSRVKALRYAGEAAGPESSVYREAERECAVMAATWGKAQNTLPFEDLIAKARRAIKRGEADDQFKFVRSEIQRLAKASVHAGTSDAEDEAARGLMFDYVLIELATNVSVEAMLDVKFGRRGRRDEDTGEPPLE